MANPKRIPPKPPPPVIPGGKTRPSLRVSLAKHRIVAQRRALNLRLLSATCAFSTPSPDPVRLRDVELLRKVTSERFAAEQSLLRIQAVRQLGRVQSLEGVNHLVGLATSPVEGEYVRAAASAALMSVSPQISQVVLASLKRDRSRLVQQTAARLAGVGYGALGKRPTERRARKRRRKSRAPAQEGQPRRG
jgi:HEAT repeat protein